MMESNNKRSKGGVGSQPARGMPKKDAVPLPRSFRKRESNNRTAKVCDGGCNKRTHYHFKNKDGAERRIAQKKKKESGPLCVPLDKLIRCTEIVSVCDGAGLIHLHEVKAPRQRESSTNDMDADVSAEETLLSDPDTINTLNPQVREAPNGAYINNNLDSDEESFEDVVSERLKRRDEYIARGKDLTSRSNSGDTCLSTITAESSSESENESSWRDVSDEEKPCSTLIVAHDTLVETDIAMYLNLSEPGYWNRCYNNLLAYLGVQKENVCRGEFATPVEADLEWQVQNKKVFKAFGVTIPLGNSTESSGRTLLTYGYNSTRRCKIYYRLFRYLLEKLFEPRGAHGYNGNPYLFAISKDAVRLHANCSFYLDADNLPYTLNTIHAFINHQYIAEQQAHTVQARVPSSTILNAGSPVILSQHFQ